jgi:hypothetical protein
MLLTISRSARFALECLGAFLFEKRTEPYIKYGKGASQKKMAPGLKKLSKALALPEFGGAAAEGAV